MVKIKPCLSSLTIQIALCAIFGFGNMHADVLSDTFILAKGGHHHGGHHHGHHHHHHHHHRRHAHHWHHHHGRHGWFHHNHHPNWNHHRLAHWNNYHHPYHDWYWYGQREGNYGWNGSPGYYYDPNYYWQAGGTPTIEYEYDEHPNNIPTNVNIEEELKLSPNNPLFNDEANFKDVEEENLRETIIENMNRESLKHHLPQKGVRTQGGKGH